MAIVKHLYGVVCDGVEICDTALDCQAGPPAQPGASCEDGDECTLLDTCDGAGGCASGQIDPNDLTCSPNGDPGPTQIGGEIIPIESTSLILAGAQSFSWMIPVVLSILGIGLFVVRKSENS